MIRKISKIRVSKPFIVGAALVLTLHAPAELLPGYLTDPTSNWRELKPDGYRTPDHLKYPYVSTYYVEPTRTAGQRCTVSYYVTDFDHAKWRFGDESRRFDVTLRLTTDRTTFKTEVQRKVASGNGKFDLGALPVGEYYVGVTAKDLQNGLTSHTVWQEFRVVAQGALDIPEQATWRVSQKDLAKHGITADPGYERLHLIEVSEDPAIHHKNNFYVRNKELAKMYLDFIDGWLKENPHKDSAGQAGYDVYAPAWKGVALDRAYQRRRVVYDAKYDRVRVAEIAAANSAGLQKLLDDAHQAGKRKVVMAPGVFRVSHKHTLTLPDRMTLDLNGATLKLNGHAGERSLMVKIAAVTDAHLVNGTLEGDYWEHDYDAKESGQSEWVCGWSIESYAKYCSVERINTKNIVGYGGGNGMSKDGVGTIGMARGEFFTLGRYYAMSDRKNKMEPGGLAADGTVDASDKAQWTSVYHDIGVFQKWGWLTVSKMLGYQGVRTRGWNFRTAFYDADKKCLGVETCFQYRNILLPPNAKYARFSIEVASAEEAEKNDLSIILFKIPRNCVIAHNVYDRCRAVGHASSAMSNFLFLENEFMHSGECLATCAFDAEDGWDGMQDVLFLRNNFHDNNRSELLTCAGHNFQMIQNRAKISLAPRTFSAYVKGNICETAKFECANRVRTGYARYIDNTYRRHLILGGERTAYTDWDIVLSGLTFESANPTNKLIVTGGATGRFRDCAFKNVEMRVASAENCTFADSSTGLMRWLNGRWTDCKAENCSFTKIWCTNLFVNCTFPQCKFTSMKESPQKFVKCDLSGATFSPRLDPKPVFDACTGVK